MMWLGPIIRRTVPVMDLSTILLIAQAQDWAANGRARELRTSAGLTQQQVADHCGVTGTAVAHWEAAVRTPRGRPAVRWARLLSELASRTDSAAASA